jgi:hypothetical protein
MATNKPANVPLTSPPESTNDEAPISIAKPNAPALDKFKSTRRPTLAGVETLLTALPPSQLAGSPGLDALTPE